MRLAAFHSDSSSCPCPARASKVSSVKWFSGAPDGPRERVHPCLLFWSPSLPTLFPLQDIEPLGSLPSLLRLDLRDNPITKKPNYRRGKLNSHSTPLFCMLHAAFPDYVRRLSRQQRRPACSRGLQLRRPWLTYSSAPCRRLSVIARLPNLKLLDYQRVKPSEREAAAKIVAAAGDGEGGKTFVPGEGLEAAAEEPKKTGPTVEQLTAIRAAIANATTLEEVQRLENALKSGDVDTTMVDAQ